MASVLIHECGAEGTCKYATQATNTSKRINLHRPSGEVSERGAFGANHFTGWFFASHAIYGDIDALLLPLDYMYAALGRTTVSFMF
jgi:hypothetical protein